MRRPSQVLAGLGICVTLLVVSVLLAGGLDPKVPVSAPGPALRTAASLTAAGIKVIPHRADLTRSTSPGRAEHAA